MPEHPATGLSGAGAERSAPARLSPCNAAVLSPACGKAVDRRGMMPAVIHRKPPLPPLFTIAGLRHRAHDGRVREAPFRRRQTRPPGCGGGGTSFPVPLSRRNVAGVGRRFLRGLARQHRSRTAPVIGAGARRPASRPSRVRHEVAAGESSPVRAAGLPASRNARSSSRRPSATGVRERGMRFAVPSRNGPTPCPRADLCPGCVRGRGVPGSVFTCTEPGRLQEASGASFRRRAAVVSQDPRPRRLFSIRCFRAVNPVASASRRHGAVARGRAATFASRFNRLNRPKQ